MAKQCTVEGCTDSLVARGLCPRHYQRWKKHGDVSYVHDQRAAGPCVVEGCGNVPLARGWCSLHYDRWRRNGDPLEVLAIRRTTAMSDADAFWQKVDRSGACWIWLAATDAGGYGRFWYQDRVRGAHVVSYEWAIGLVPAGLELDHLCRNHACVRPEHLEPVTHAENVRRGELGIVTKRRFQRLREAPPVRA